MVEVIVVVVLDITGVPGANHRITMLNALKEEREGERKERERLREKREREEYRNGL